MVRKTLLLTALLCGVVTPGWASPNAGDTAPTIAAGSWTNLPNGMTTLPQEYLKGQIVMLEFWATW